MNYNLRHSNGAPCSDIYLLVPVMTLDEEMQEGQHKERKDQEIDKREEKRVKERRKLSVQQRGWLKERDCHCHELSPPFPLLISPESPSLHQQGLPWQPQPSS